MLPSMAIPSAQVGLIIAAAGRETLLRNWSWSMAFDFGGKIAWHIPFPQEATHMSSVLAVVKLRHRMEAPVWRVMPSSSRWKRTITRT